MFTQLLVELMLCAGAGPAHLGVTMPHGLGWNDTYTITTVVKVLRPCEPAVMTDPYQDVKVLSDDGNCLTLSVTYFPLKDKVREFRTRTYATKSGDLARYLQPTVTCNWNAVMRAELVHDLKQAGIDSSKLTPSEYVSRVASWAFRTSSFAANSSAMPSDWFVAFAKGRSEVYPPDRLAFDESKTDPTWTDREVFAHQLLGRQMFGTRSHGACTSSSIYLATILRALGIPTRILYFIPACDSNDPAQFKLLTSAITRRTTRRAVIDGLQNVRGFADHMFDEVWLDGRWQRLNYGTLGQDIVDENYFGLLTHIDTCADISETHLAQTWGRRVARWPDVKVRLSSVNPYQLIAASDHWGKGAKRDDSAQEEITEATVVAVLWPGTPSFSELIPAGNGAPKTDLFLAIKEWIPGRSYRQLREFIAGADGRFILRSPGHPDVGLHYNGMNCNNDDERGFCMSLDESSPAIVPGASYTLVPRNENAKHLWKVASGLRVTVPGP